MATSADRLRAAAARRIALARGGRRLRVHASRRRPGCTSQDARIIASQGRTWSAGRATSSGSTGVKLLHAGGRVWRSPLGCATSRLMPVNDVPISVGVRGRSGARTYLNRAAEPDYFKTHVAVIPARASATWVFIGRAPRDLTGAPFAVARRSSVPPITVARTIPRVRAVLQPVAQCRRGLRLTVTNGRRSPRSSCRCTPSRSSGGRYTAAGSATSPPGERGPRPHPASIWSADRAPVR